VKRGFLCYEISNVRDSVERIYGRDVSRNELYERQYSLEFWFGSFPAVSLWLQSVYRISANPVSSETVRILLERGVFGPRELHIAFVACYQEGSVGFGVIGVATVRPVHVFNQGCS